VLTGSLADLDSNQLSAEQLDALRRWLAAGGRLVIVGGSAGIGTLSAFPDDILPFRPTATLDLDPALLTSLLGPLPVGSADLPAMAGVRARGRALATSGDRVVAADLGYGNGRSILSFDPTRSGLRTTRTSSRSGEGAARSNRGRRAAGRRCRSCRQCASPGARAPAHLRPLAIIAAYILSSGRSTT
jgi:hypothetical protein